MSIIHHPSPFSQNQIEQLSDVTIPHKDLAQKFNISIEKVKLYRRSALGIHLRGLNYDFEKICDSVDWSRATLDLAIELKVSPMTVKKWQRLVRDKSVDPINCPRVAQILASDEKSATLASKLNISSDVVRYIRRKHGVVLKRGRRSMTAADFPAIKDWKQSANSIATKTGISWKVADRIRSEALMAEKAQPIVAEQLEFASMSINKLPPELRNVDWSENTSWLMIYLGMDKEQVLRFKSIVSRQRPTLN